MHGTGTLMLPDGRKYMDKFAGSIDDVFTCAGEITFTSSEKSGGFVCTYTTETFKSTMNTLASMLDELENRCKAKKMRQENIQNGAKIRQENIQELKKKHASIPRISEEESQASEELNT